VLLVLKSNCKVIGCGLSLPSIKDLLSPLLSPLSFPFGYQIAPERRMNGEA
jgi:hypothetical protein